MQKLFKANDPTIGTVYSLRQDQLGNIYYLVGSYRSDLAEVRAPIHFGTYLDSPRQALIDVFKSSSQFSIDQNTHRDDMGTWISAYAPVIDEAGKKVGVFGFDISADSLVSAERNMLITTFIILAIALPIFAGIGWLIGRRFAHPIIQLNEGVNRITSGELHLVVNVKSGDEVEALADSFNIMTGRVNICLICKEGKMGLSKADHSVSPPRVDIPRDYNTGEDLIGRNLEAGRGAKIAYIDDAGQYSYAELNERVNRCAGGLRALGLEMESRVMVAMLDTIDWPVAFLGAIKAGIVPIAANTLLTTKDYELMLSDSRARALLVSEALLPQFAPLLGKMPFLKHVIVSGADAKGHTAFKEVLAKGSPQFATAPTTRDTPQSIFLPRG